MHVGTLHLSKIRRTEFQIDIQVIEPRNLADAIGIQLAPTGLEAIRISIMNGS